MTHERAGNDADAVLETVRAFFAERPAPLDSLHGPLHEWNTQLRESFPSDAFVYTPFVDSVELVDLKPSSAVVQVRARQLTVSRTSAKKTLAVNHGPVLLEKVTGSWRIVDYCSDGQQRLDALIVGRLAEQHRDGVTVRAVGVDRTSSATPCVLEIDNQSAAVEPGATRRVLLTAKKLPKSRTDLPLAVELAASNTRLPVVLHFSLERRAEPLVETAPRRLPIGIHGDLFLTIAYWAALGAVLLWQFGWPALVVPLVFVVLYGRQLRRRRALRRR